MNDHVTVLIVEDEEDSRESLKEWLELEGYRVATAADGREALDWIERHRHGPCIVLLDLFMPVVDGWQVYETLRSRGKLSTVKVIVTTSAPHRAPAGSTVLSKPLDLDALVRALRACAAGTMRMAE
jgi:CheY-like chemotaxis protein